MSTLIVLGIIVISLLGLLIMDYQLRKATDITGAYLESGSTAYISENMLTGAVVFSFIVFLLAVFTFAKVRKSRLISTMPLAKINDEIKKIDEHLKGPNPPSE
jgi:hypothetical protein